MKTVLIVTLCTYIIYYSRVFLVKSVVDAINNCKNLEYLNLEGNTLGVEAARSIATALEKHPELKRALWKDMFTGRMKTEIPKALVNHHLPLIHCILFVFIVEVIIFIRNIILHEQEQKHGMNTFYVHSI